MGLDRFEFLELRRDGEIQTYHAREIATARPVQVHLFARGRSAESLALLGMINQLPEPERRRILDRGESHGMPYVVTDRLAGYADLREWISANVSPAAPQRRPPSVDDQFFALFDAPTIPGPAAYPAPQSYPARWTPEPLEPNDTSGGDVLSQSVEMEAFEPQRDFLPTAAKSAIWVVLGVLTALAFLAAIAAFYVFRP